MASSNNHHSNQVLIAIDIAKKNHDVFIAWPSGKTKAIKITNSLAGYKRIMTLADTPPNNIHVAFEPTADYHRNIAL